MSNLKQIDDVHYSMKCILTLTVNEKLTAKLSTIESNLKKTIENICLNLDIDLLNLEVLDNKMLVTLDLHPELSMNSIADALMSGTGHVILYKLVDNEENHNENINVWCEEYSGESLDGNENMLEEVEKYLGEKND